MALLQTFHLEHLPSSHAVHVALFQNVRNCASLHQQLLSGNTAFEYAFIDASVILSRLHALAASFRAVNDALEERLKSRNVHSEIVFALSPNNNIAESFRRFGIAPTTQNLLVIKVSSPSAPFSAEEVQKHLSEVVEGEQIPFEDDRIEPMTDVARVKKIYKLNATGGSTASKKGQVNGVSDVDAKQELMGLVISSMALRGAAN